MSAPKIPTTHPLVTAVAKQLQDALRLDNVLVPPFGEHTLKVLAEIVGAAVR